MTHTFMVLQANEQENVKLLASMHHLRWAVFKEELNWTAGLTSRNCMEFDDYDRSYANYIVRVNPEKEVDACCRVIPTDKPYMLAECYPEFVENRELPQSANILEVSRFASSLEARKQTQGTIMAQLIVAMIEYGLKNNITNYVSLTTDKVVPIIRKAGWDPTTLGSKKSTPDDNSYSLIQTVSFEMLDRVKQRNNIQNFLLYDLSENKNIIIKHSNDNVGPEKTIDNKKETVPNIRLG